MQYCPLCIQLNSGIPFYPTVIFTLNNYFILLFFCYVTQIPFYTPNALSIFLCMGISQKYLQPRRRYHHAVVPITPNVPSPDQAHSWHCGQVRDSPVPESRRFVATTRTHQRLPIPLSKPGKHNPSFCHTRRASESCGIACCG